MRDPGAVVAGTHLAQLVGAHARERQCVRRRVAGNRDLCGHAAHRQGTAAMAGLDQQLGIIFQERHAHADLSPLRQHAIAVPAESLDVREDVVPASAVEADAAPAQRVQDLVHLEHRRQGFDQHRDLDRADRQTECELGEFDGLVPQRRFEMTLQLRQIQIRAAFAQMQHFCIVENEQTKIEQCAGQDVAINQCVLFRQMPAARTQHQHRRIRSEAILAAVRRAMRNRSGHCIAQINLTFDQILPGRCGRILEIGHEHLGA